MKKSQIKYLQDLECNLYFEYKELVTILGENHVASLRKLAAWSTIVDVMKEFKIETCVDLKLTESLLNIKNVDQL